VVHFIASADCPQTVMETIDGRSDQTHRFFIQTSESEDCPQTAMETIDGCSDQTHIVIMQIFAHEDCPLIAMKISEESYYKTTQNRDAIFVHLTTSL
jgi:hypothetical protein